LSEAEPILAVESARPRPRQGAVIGAVALVLAALAAGCTFASRPEPLTDARTGTAPVAPSIERPPPVAPEPGPGAQGSVEELLEGARAAFASAVSLPRTATTPWRFTARCWPRTRQTGSPRGLDRIGAVLDERLQSGWANGGTTTRRRSLGSSRSSSRAIPRWPASNRRSWSLRLAAAVENGALDRANLLVREAASAQTLTAERLAHWHDGDRPA